MLGDYIKRLTDKGYKISFENPIEEADWIWQRHVLKPN